MEIKFRGKRVDNGEWVYGHYIQDAVDNEDRQGFDYPSLIRQEYGDHFMDFEVIRETVGQYTGLKDKNGKDVYEGDLLQIKCLPKEKREITICEWTNDISYAGWNLRKKNEELGSPFLFRNFTNLEIIGNIHDNKELIND